MKQEHIYNIPFGVNFLQELANEILGKYANDPIYFSNLTILLPNRRSCRELANILFKTSDNKSLLLPNITPIGEIDEDEVFFQNNLERHHGLNVISQIRQRMILTKLIEQWKSNTDSKTVKTQSALLSLELAAFLDEVEKEQLSFDKIENLVPDKFSKHWQLTLEFLQIATVNWPNILQQYNCINSPSNLNYLLKAKSDYLEENGSNYPIIIADSADAIPAVRQLIKTVSNLSNGYIYLHGLNQNLSEKTWINIEESHPQWGLKQLLEYLEIKRSEIANLQDYKSSSKPIGRSSFITNIMLPAGDIVSNIAKIKIDDQELKNFEVVNCPDLYNEATIIAMKIRQAVQNNINSIALVTNNSTLTKLVGLELKKWDIDINDSIGMDLKDTPQAVFLRLVAKMICENFSSPINILASLKHAYCNCGYKTIDFKSFVTNLESQCFRGIRKKYNLYSIKNELDEDTAIWWQKIINIVKPLADIIYENKFTKIDFKEILIKHIKIAEELAKTDEESGSSRLYKHDKGIKFKEFLDELLLNADEINDIDIKEYPSLFEVMMEGKKYNPPYNSNEKITVLAPIETRLHAFDLAIISGLNDNSWPNLSDSNPFMNKAMRADFGLGSIEKRIGQSARDFCNLLSNNNIFITRSIKEEGVFTIKSRWLSRIETILKISNSNLSIDSSHQWQEWFIQLNKPNHFITPKRSVANPPISARPRELSVTYFEKLMRDPYAIYAKKILNLKKLDDIDQDPTMADFGSFIHLALDMFIKNYDEKTHNDKYQELIKIGNNLADQKGIKSHMFKFWQAKFERVAGWFVENEKNIRQEQVKIHSEIDGKLTLLFDDGQFTIKARADRIEQDVNGNLTIIDYKTGSLPTLVDIQLGYSPQMTLQGLIASNDGFELSGKLEQLIYWKLGNGKDITQKESGYRKNQTPEQLISDTENNIRQLIDIMFFKQTPLIACPNSQKQPTFNEYEHLERI